MPAPTAPILMLERLQQMGVLTHVRNPMSEGLGPQESAMQHFLSLDDVQQLDWVLHIDADEFLNVQTGQGRVGDLLAVAGDADVMALMWRPFGNNGLTRWSGGSVLETFTATQARPRAHECATQKPVPAAQLWGCNRPYAERTSVGGCASGKQHGYHM
ncbi:glycosyltransferase family 2 protein [Marivita sp.]|uniref:glycosyltransferase family 2 protein n=1 Tax=Marivita sp. TaxID=2003365 RepID=UPI003B5A468B